MHGSRSKISAKIFPTSTTNFPTDSETQTNHAVYLRTCFCFDATRLQATVPKLHKSNRNRHSQCNAVSKNLILPTSRSETTIWSATYTTLTLFITDSHQHPDKASTSWGERAKCCQRHSVVLPARTRTECETSVW
jgi:hypothetical protein